MLGFLGVDFPSFIYRHLFRVIADKIVRMGKSSTGIGFVRDIVPGKALPALVGTEAHGDTHLASFPPSRDDGTALFTATFLSRGVEQVGFVGLSLTQATFTLGRAAAQPSAVELAIAARTDDTHSHSPL
jgi:hypothetical protein